MLDNIKKLSLIVILSPADPLRLAVCHWAKQSGLVAECFEDIYDAISRIYIKPQDCEYFILCRPFTFDWETADILKTILGGGNARFVIWAKNGCVMPPPPPIAFVLHRLEELNHIFKFAGHSDIQKKDALSERIKNCVQLTDEELTMLLGTHHETE